MPHPDAPPPFWVRLVADERFCTRLIDDPLRALADAGPIEVSPEQVRQLEDLTVDERRDLVTGFVHEVHMRGGQARFGRIGDDGRIGGPDNPEVR